MRDSSGNPFVRHEQKIVTDSPTLFGSRHILRQAQDDIKNKTPDSRLKVEQSEAKPESKARTDWSFVCNAKKQNSGNQPEFQSSIKKRTVNQTVSHRF